jgi:phosphatidylglycerophosphate synthase
LGLRILLGVLALSAISMLIWVLTEKYKSFDPLESQSRGDFVLGGFLRDWFYWFVDPLRRFAILIGMGPLSFNLLGVLFGVLSGIAFASGHLALGGWSILLGGIADVLDGRIARSLGIADKRGAFLDSTLDRFAEVGMFCGLIYLFRDSQAGLLFASIGLGGSVLVSYTRARGESLGVTCKLGLMQRAERLLLVGLGGILDPTISAAWGSGQSFGFLLIPLLGLLSIGTIGTSVFRTFWIARQLKEESSQ